MLENPGSAVGNPTSALGCAENVSIIGATVNGKGKVFLYSLPSVRPGADPGVQAVSPQVT